MNVLGMPKGRRVGMKYLFGCCAKFVSSFLLQEVRNILVIMLGGVKD